MVFAGFLINILPMRKRKLIKQRWVILAVVILVILVIIGALYLWQQENIEAAANARKYTHAELTQQLDASRDLVQSTLDAHPEITVRAPTEEERNALRSGSVSPQELVNLLTRPQASAVQAPASDPGVTPSAPGSDPQPPAEPAKSPEQEAYEAELSALIAEVYVMREQYTAQLDALVAEAKAEYKAKPQSERTKAKLVSWATGYISRATQMESQCDAEMEAVFVRMRRLIRSNGGDLSILKAVSDSYFDEKSIQKSIYIQELEKRGIM